MNQIKWKRLLDAGHRISLVLLSLICFSGIAFSAAQNHNDMDIVTAVEVELMMDQAVPSYLLDVRCKEGIVTLAGTVNNLLARDRARDIAETVKGVRAVVNRINVDPVKERSDDAIHSDVVNALYTNPATEYFDIAVSVEKGKTTLTGTVDSYVEKRLAEKVTKGISGVVSVENQIEMKYKTDRSDSDFRHDIKESMRWDTLVDQNLIRVTVKGKQVTLKGTVGSAAEKSRAITHAWMPGIKDVDADGLKVERWARDPDLRTNKYTLKPDKEIKAAVESALLHDPRVLSTRVSTRVTDGIVTLSGRVNYLQAKRAAAQDARNTVGVVRVKNHLKVVPPVKTIGNAELEDKILERLDADAYLGDYDFKANVIAGAADLYGTVDTYYEKIRAEDLASEIAGILYVDNNIVVKKTWHPMVFNPYVDESSTEDYAWHTFKPGITTHKSDWKITENIRDELFWSPFVDADQVTVVVDDGKATLTGQVDSWSEYDAATQNALQGGAVSVDNDLTISYLAP
ncbi:MAG TPA: hypothetical protein DHV36_13370 [Desulfobacteraceae bacterium]|nr:hypothetical protein [Desulfobacteraceae bacterium]